MNKPVYYICLCHSDNVALRGVAAQSSQFSDRNAHYAIDGNRNTNYGSCSHTAQDTNPWWRVDLLDVYNVTAVTITNRDACPERLDGAEIRIGNSLENNGINNPRCVVISHIPAGETNTFQCNEMDGRYVVVVIYVRKEYLTLCELEVYGTPAVNVALKGVASQSSLNGYGNAHNAIDGNRESNYDKRSCTHTEQETNPWWRVDLLDVTRVTAVSITNRGDGVPERLDGAEIRIGNSLENNGINNPRCDVISNIPAGKTYTFQCNAMEGRYVVVVIPGRSEWLTLCEVEVFATVKTPESSTEAPKSKRMVVRMKIQSDADLTNQAVGDQLLQQASERGRERQTDRESE
uniref:Fucolectin tachylectin-4 pentraxin-1 domain-containing protein n=1 Tax=Oncorhynchus kisutch TaxID=8019 RepID=A0A8C7DQD7_ONCKI